MKTPNNIGQHATIKCPGCGVEIVYYDVQESAYYACSLCATYFKQEHDDPAEVIKKFFPNEVATPSIPLGSTGVIDSKTFTVVGFLQKRDTNHEATWKEYLLFNPKLDNYHVLSEYNGHWTLLWHTDLSDFRIFPAGFSTYEIRGTDPTRTFSQYTTYSFEIPWAVGEFDWNITADEGPHMEVYEFIDPPAIIVTEEDAVKKDCYWGKFIDRTEVAAAFGVSMSDLPPKFGKGVLEIPKFMEQSRPLQRFTLLILGLIVFVPMIISMFSPATKIFAANYTTSKDTTTWSGIHPIVSEPFEVKKSGALNLTFQTSIDNDWMELSVSLVNNSTGKTYNFTKVFEYWHGYSDGESWSEGDWEDDASLSDIPKGVYHLNIYPYTESASPINLGVIVEQNTVLYSNLIIMVLLVLIYPWILHIKKSAHNGELFG